MRSPVIVWIGLFLVLSAASLHGQSHGLESKGAAKSQPAKTPAAEAAKTSASAPAASARPEPVRAAPPLPTVAGSRAETQQFTPKVPAAKVAEAVAQAIREAEAAAARRAARAPIRPILPRQTTGAPAAPAKRYEIRWPEQRMVVRWPDDAPTDRLSLTWPSAF